MNVVLCCVQLSILHSNLNCKVTELRGDFGGDDCLNVHFMLFVEVIVKCFRLGFVPRVLSWNLQSQFVKQT